MIIVIKGDFCEPFDYLKTACNEISELKYETLKRKRKQFPIVYKDYLIVERKLNKMDTSNYKIRNW